MGERATENGGVLAELGRALADGPHERDELLDRARSALAGRFSLDDTAVLRVGDVERAGSLPPALDRAAATRAALLVRDGRVGPPLPDGDCVLVVPIVGAEVLAFLVGVPPHDGEPTGAELQSLTWLGVALGAYVEQAERCAQLVATIDDLRRLDEAKGQFVSLASHELRTPISVVHGVAATLHARGDDLTAEQLTDLRALLFGQTTRLAELTNQLLDLSRIDAGAMRLRNERFSPRERFETLLPRLAPERAGDVELEIDPALEIVTDPDAFERVVSNLVVNALRYGRPPVTVRCRTRGAFRLEVEDKGGGVDPELVPQLFDRFTRGRHDRSAGLAGAGLGLAIASSFANALGGDLRYESAAPAGARFVLRLPLGER
jgi:signal transduction histidine kinase